MKNDHYLLLWQKMEYHMLNYVTSYKVLEY